MDVLDKTGLGTLWNKIKSFAYSKAQTDSLLGGKAAASHTHPVSQVTGDIPGNRIGGIPLGAAANGVFPKDYGLIQSANRIELIPGSQIDVEYSRDGGATWTDYGMTDEEKSSLTMTGGGRSANVGGRSSKQDVTLDDRVRVTIASGISTLYFLPHTLYIWSSTCGSVLHVTVSARRGTSDSWEALCGDINLRGDSGGTEIGLFNGLPFGGYSLNDYYHWIRLEFRITSLPTYNVPKLLWFAIFGDRSWLQTNNLQRTGHLYAYDALKNATFPAEVRATRLVTGGGTDAQLVTGTGGLLAKSSLAAASHTHSRSQITDFDHDHDDAYAAKSHTHTTQDVAGLYSSLSQMSGKIQDFERDMIVADEKGAANGVATLDSNGKIPTAQLPDNAVAGLSGFSMTVYRSSLSVSSFGMSGTTATVARVSSGVYKVTLSSISTCSFGNVRIFLQPQGLTSGNNGYTACLLTSQTSNEMQFKVETTSGSASDNWGKMNILCIR